MWSWADPSSGMAMPPFAGSIPACFVDNNDCTVCNIELYWAVLSKGLSGYAKYSIHFSDQHIVSLMYSRNIFIITIIPRIIIFAVVCYVAILPTQLLAKLFLINSFISPHDMLGSLSIILGQNKPALVMRYCSFSKVMIIHCCGVTHIYVRILGHHCLI